MNDNTDTSPHNFASVETQPISMSMNFDEDLKEDDDDVQIWCRLVPNQCKNIKYNSGIQISKSPFNFGRNKTKVDYVLEESEISGLHAIITQSPTNAELTDKSTNGTYINNRKIGKNSTAPLFDRDIITFIIYTACDSRTGQERHELSFIFYTNYGRHKEIGEIFEKYDLRDTLGTGSFAVVKLGICRMTGDRYAVKAIDKQKYENKSKLRKKDSINNEWKIMMEIDHKNVVRIHDIYDTEKVLYLVLDLAKGGELFHRIINKQKLDEQICRYVLKQLLDAIMYLHSMKIAHRDLKPENILMVDINSWTIKITDFGLSRLLCNKEVLTTMCGTPLFLAPEILLSKSTGGYGFEVDYWSMGVVLYLMLVGHPPYNEKDGELLELVRNARCSFPTETWRNVSKSACDLVHKMMTKDPQQRITGEEMLNHPWVRGLSEMDTGNHKNVCGRGVLRLQMTDVDMQRNVMQNNIIGHRKRDRNEMQDLTRNSKIINENEIQPNKKQKLLNGGEVRVARNMMSMDIITPFDSIVNRELSLGINDMSMKSQPTASNTNTRLNEKKSNGDGGGIRDYYSQPLKKEMNVNVNVNGRGIGNGASYADMSVDNDG